MKKTIYALALLVCLGFGACYSGVGNEAVKSEPAFRLYPTSNMWNFLKLDTRNGKITIVQFSIEDKRNQYEYILSDKALTDGDVPGRYILQPTENNFNYIMLDQVSGQTYQVQWSFDKDSRLVIPIETVEGA